VYNISSSYIVMVHSLGILYYITHVGIVPACLPPYLPAITHTAQWHRSFVTRKYSKNVGAFQNVVVVVVVVVVCV